MVADDPFCNCPRVDVPEKFDVRAILSSLIERGVRDRVTKILTVLRAMKRSSRFYGRGRKQKTSEKKKKARKFHLRLTFLIEEAMRVDENHCLCYALGRLPMWRVR